MVQCSRKKVGLTIGMTKNAVKSMDYSKFIGLGLKLQSYLRSFSPFTFRFPGSQPPSFPA